MMGAAARVALAPLRLLGLVFLLLAGLPIAAFVFPWLAQPARNRTIRRWSALLCAVCGLRVRRAGVALPADLADTGMQAWSPGRLVLANHVSWIDIFALNAMLPGRFVAKAEIGRWPLLGRLVALSGTIFIERGRRHAVAAINHRVRDCLKAGESVVVFPEGTTTDGTHLLPFHSNLLAPAVDTGAPIWPVALRYTSDGRPTRAPAFVGEQTLPESLWAILTAPRLAIEIAVLAPIEPKGATRHHLAALAEAAIAAHLEVPIVPAGAASAATSSVRG